MTRLTFAPILALALPLATTPAAQTGGRDLETWNAHVEARRGPVDGRCLAPEYDPARFPWQDSTSYFGAQSDCSYGNTNPTAEYAPGVTYEIQVVFHVLQSTSGQGFIGQAQVESQVDVLNEDFLALPGSNGAPGNDARIRFVLATEDPAGNPTTGVTYTTSDPWFNDSGNYWMSLAWDPSRYLNIYTNTAGSSLGYVPDIPQGGIAGQRPDRVVVDWRTIGKDAPYGPPWDQGRIATHEVGHYLGLVHTFYAGCGTASCYTTGDRICDTNPQSTSTNGCPASKSTCGSPDPIHNYMDYTDDACIWEFTDEQVRRMRCTIQEWRTSLATVIPPDPLAVSTTGISLAGGGSLDLAIETTSDFEGAIYWVFGSATGTSPGIDFGGGVVLPLNVDAYFQLLLTRPTAAPFQGFLGLLDHNGRADASMTIPAGSDPGLSGVQLHHAYLVSETFGTADYASEAEPLLLLP